MRAILSVSNKDGLVDFARRLQELKVEIYSTGGTKKSLTEAGLKEKDFIKQVENKPMLV